MNQIILLKQNEKWSTYQADGFKICYRNQWSISWDNSVNEEELIYLITWSAEITLQDIVRTAQAPAMIEFPAKTYHAIKALTDISFILYQK
jgi:hypothetical protein